MTDLNTIKETFALLDSWEDRYCYLIDLGGALPPLLEEHKTEENKVEGCMNPVWLLLDASDNVLNIRAASDGRIASGLIALVIAIYNGKPLDEISSIDIKHIFLDLGLEEHLHPLRRNGFFAMVEKIRSAPLNH